MRIYKEIIEIKFSHNYYPDGFIANNDFKIEPTFETQKIFDNYRIILKNNSNSIKLIQECEQTKSETNPIIEIIDNIKFSFVIKLVNKDFFTYTNIPFLNLREDIFYFSNKKNNKIIQKGTLTKEKTVSEKDIETIKKDKDYGFILQKRKSYADIIGYISIFANNTINNSLGSANISYGITITSSSNYNKIINEDVREVVNEARFMLWGKPISTTGQAILLDNVISKICRKMEMLK